MQDIIELRNIDQWEKLRNNLTEKEELVIFKFSPVCSISAMVEEDFSSWRSNLEDNSNLKIAKVNVIDKREVSLKIAADLQVLHQSPQVIWIDGNSKIKWTASHFDISKDSLKAHQ